ncbi:hypothetical protein LNTAR_18388 [Lentisphaera araneosa HTCC2155]|uniref:Uncharacterized protein n=1 Tax=Lentisphaera araneosa HTCC2155 TaxID=313628 RepID=A6DG16_9BACT|nr:hypothetical protein [Lentisphaera araneosa]EDM29746.1 hypothetical protein LNTAR_18388 [Lentisphaera araneosa HTCC2155]
MSKKIYQIHPEISDLAHAFDEKVQSYGLHKRLGEFDPVKSNDLNWDQFPDFFSIAPNFLIFKDISLDIRMWDILGDSGEVVFSHNDQKVCALNPLVSYNCLNKQRTKFQKKELGNSIITEYCFHTDRIHGLSLFHIPETYMKSIYCISDDEYPDSDFYRIYKELKLTGLSFKKVWFE